MGYISQIGKSTWHTLSEIIYSSDVTPFNSHFVWQLSYYNSMFTQDSHPLIPSFCWEILSHLNLFVGFQVPDNFWKESQVC